MRKRIEGLTGAVRQVLENHGTALWWKDICLEIKDRNLVYIEPEQEELTHGQPNFHHSVRRILTELVRGREVMRIERGMYIIHSKQDKGDTLGTQFITENNVLIAVAKWLHKNGWQIKQVSVASGQRIDYAEEIKKLRANLDSIGVPVGKLKFTSQGADIEALHETEVWKIECKGMGNVKLPTLKNNFDRAVASAVSYYDSNTGLRIGLALPEEYSRLINAKLPSALREAINLWVLLYVSADDEVYVFEPDETLPQ